MATRMVSKGDFGFIFNLSLTDTKGIAIEILDDDVNIYVVSPDKSEQELNDTNVTIVDNIAGKIRVEIPLGFTDQTGNYTLYLELHGASYKFNTNEGISYYVSDRHGIA